MGMDNDVSEIKQNISKLIKKEGGAFSVINAVSEVFLHNIHDKSRGNMAGKKEIFRDFHKRNYNEHWSLLDHAMWYPGLIVYHPHQITQKDMLFLTEECSEHGLNFLIDGSSSRVLGFGVRLIIYNEETTPQQLQKAASW